MSKRVGVVLFFLALAIAATAASKIDPGIVGVWGVTQRAATSSKRMGPSSWKAQSNTCTNQSLCAAIPGTGH